MKRKRNEERRIKDYSAEWCYAEVDRIEAYLESRVDQKAHSLASTTFRRNSKSRPLDDSPEPTAEPTLELEHAFAEAIACLPARQREVIRLTSMDFADAEIAEHLGIHRNTVRRDRLDAYATLRRLLGSEKFSALRQVLEAANPNSDARVDK